MASFVDHSKVAQKTFKMVMIGQTGAGKTEFLEFLHNYSDQYGKARQYGENDYKLDKIKSFVRSSVERKRKKETWESDTTFSKNIPPNSVILLSILSILQVYVIQEVEIKRKLI